MIEPLLDRVLVKRLEESSAPKSKIEIPQQYQQKNKECEVVALGQGVVLGGQMFPLSDFLSVGDIVMISDYGDEEINVDGEDYVLIRIQDIRGKKKKAKASLKAVAR